MAFEKLNQLVQTVEELKEKMRLLAQAEIKPALQEAVVQLKQAVPTITSVYWNQYRPFFNDGDVCVFSVHGVYGKFEGYANSEDDWERELCSDYKYLGAKFGLTQSQNDLLNAFESAIQALGEEGGPLELAFEDSMTVTIDIRTGTISTEYCEHD